MEYTTKVAFWLVLVEVVALVQIFAEIRVARSPNALGHLEQGKQLVEELCDMPIDDVRGFPQFSNLFRKSYCRKADVHQTAKESDNNDRRPPSKSKSLGVVDIVFISLICILLTILLAVGVYKMKVACWSSCRTCFARLFKRRSPSKITEIELETFTGPFVPRLSISCNLSKKPGCYTKIPKRFTKQHMAYDIDDQKYYFDIIVNVRTGRFRHTKKPEYIPMENFTFKQILNIVQELVYGTEQSQNNLMEALGNPDAESSQAVITEAILNPTAEPPSSSDDSAEELFLSHYVSAKASTEKKPKKKGSTTVTVVNESLVSEMSRGSPGTFTTHEPPEKRIPDDKSESHGYVTASTCVSSEATPKEGPSMEGSLEEIAGEEEDPVNPNLQNSEASSEQERQETGNDESSKSTKKTKENPINVIPSLQELARNSIPTNSDRHENEGNLSTTISSLEGEASSPSTKIILEHSDKCLGEASLDSKASVASEKPLVEEKLSETHL